MHTLRRYLEGVLVTGKYVAERLWIAINDREERRLDVHHDLMAFAKAVADIRQGEAQLARFVRDERLRVLERVPELASEWFRAY